MTFTVHVTATAKQDLQEIFDFLADNESVEMAEGILMRVSESLRSLCEFPLRGKFPPELERIGVHQYRELQCKPFRVLYEVQAEKVFVHCVLDARRDVQGQLLKRLVRG